MECQHCTDLLYDYLDNELDSPTHRAVADHIAHCHQCGREWQDIQTTSLLYRQSIARGALDEGFATRTIAQLDARSSRLTLLLPLISLFLSSLILGVVLLVISPVLMPILSMIYELTIALLPVAMIILGAFPFAKLVTVTLLLAIIMLATWAMHRKMLY